MYGALWRILPGSWWLRVIILVVAAAVVLSALVIWVFPYVDELVSPQEVTVKQ